MTKIQKTRLDSSVLWMSLLQSVKLSVWTNFTQRHWNSITLDSEVVLFPGKVPRRTTSNGFCPTPLPSQPWEGVLYFHPCQREKNERKIILPGLKSPNAFSGCDFPSEQFLTEWADKITPQTIRLKDRTFIIIKHHSCNYFISGIPWIFIPPKGKGRRSLKDSKYTLYARTLSMLYCNRNTGYIYWACIYCSIRVSQGSAVFSATGCPAVCVYSSCTAALFRWSLYQPQVPYGNCGILKYQSDTETKYVEVTSSGYRFIVV